MATTTTISEIDAAIEQVVSSIPQFTGGVFVGHVPDGEDIPIGPTGIVEPYAVIIFGGLIQTQRRNRGIVSVRQNIKYHTFTVLVVASTDRQSRLLADIVRDKLEGFEPLGQGEISEETSGNTKYPADTTMKPTRYVPMLSFSLLVGA